MVHKEIKQKKCCACQEPFTPFSSLSKACSPICALRLVDLANEKKDKARFKIKKELLKTRGDWLREAQANFNKFIRLRDEDQVCISCQNPPKKKNAGHYRSVGSCPELRFNELNVHLQCEHCNTYLSSNAIEYRKNLIIKIGADMVDWIEGPHDPLKLTINDIKELKKEYAIKCKELEKL